MILSFAVALALQTAPQTPTPEVLFSRKDPLVGLIASRDESQAFVLGWNTLTAIDLENGEETWSESKLLLEAPKEGPVSAKDPFPRELPAALLAVTDEHLILGTSVMIPTFRAFDLSSGVAGQNQGGTSIGKRATCMLSHKKGNFVWFGIENLGVSRLTVGDVNAWSRRATDNGGVTCMALDSKEKLIAIGGIDSSVRYAKFKSATIDKKKHHKTGMGPITAIAFGSKGKTVLVGGKKGEVRVLNTSKGKQLLSLEGPDAQVRKILVGGKGKWALVGYADGKLRFFELKKGKKILELEHPDAKRGIVGLVLLDKDQRLLSAGGNAVLTWDLPDLN